MKTLRGLRMSFQLRSSSTLAVTPGQTTPNFDFRVHVEVPRGGQLTKKKTSATEPPAGRF